MVFRCMIYDALSYINQIENKKKNGKIKLKPVITLVLYLNAGEWDGPKSIYEMLDLEEYQYVKDKIYDYKLNLISPYEINNEDFSKLTSEMRFVLKYIKYSNDEMKLEIVKNDIDFKKVSNEAVGLINEVTNSEFEKNTEGGYVNMCKAIDDMKKKAADIAVARNEEKNRVETVVNFYKNGASLELISKSTKMTIEEVKNILLQNNVELRTA